MLTIIAKRHAHWYFRSGSSQLADTTDVRAFVANFTVTFGMANCGPLECTVMSASGYSFCQDRDRDCRINAPVTESILKQEEFEKKYWALPKSWSAKAQSCPV
jgi:hypothetical protein